MKREAHIFMLGYEAILLRIDPHTPEQRSRNMAHIRGKDTKPELIVRRALHFRGFRYKLHDRSLPGTPDLVLPKFHAVVFVHGCFWHGHDCKYGTVPKTNHEFWRKKISANQNRDVVAESQLRAAGWRVLIVWECALKGTGKSPLDVVATASSNFLHSDLKYLVLRGT